MSALLAKFPVTIAERAKLGVKPLRLSASWEEYLDLLETCEYQIEYNQHEIIAMSIASDPHESIVANILGVLYNVLDKIPDMQARGSNRHVFIEEFPADYSPDAHVVKGTPVERILRKGLTANTNPYIIFEVLSPSTRDIDLGEKLPRYKKIPSVRQIIYVEQTYPLVTVYSRIGDSNRWENVDYDEPEQTFMIEGQKVRVKDLYRKVIMTK